MVSARAQTMTPKRHGGYRHTRLGPLALVDPRQARDAILSAYASDGSYRAVAARLGLSERQLHRLVGRLGLREALAALRGSAGVVGTVTTMS